MLRECFGPVRGWCGQYVSGTSLTNFYLPLFVELVTCLISFHWSGRFAGIENVSYDSKSCGRIVLHSYGNWSRCILSNFYFVLKVTQLPRPPGGENFRLLIPLETLMITPWQSSLIGITMLLPYERPDKLFMDRSLRYPWTEAVEGMLVIRLRGAGSSSPGVRTAVRLRAPRACHRHAAAARRVGLNGDQPPSVVVADFSFQV